MRKTAVVIISIYILRVLVNTTRMQLFVKTMALGGYMKGRKLEPASGSITAISYQCNTAAWIVSKGVTVDVCKKPNDP